MEAAIIDAVVDRVHERDRQVLVELVERAVRGDLLFVDLSSSIPSQNNHILSWSATTGRLVAYGTGTIVGASGQGAVVVGMDVSPALTWTNTTPGAAGSGALSLGAGPWMGIPDSAWSPDAKSLVLIAWDGIATHMDAVMVHF